MGIDKDKSQLTVATEQSHIAQEQLGVKTAESNPPQNREALRHELDVYQIEMEVQNAELRRVQQELENQQLELELQNDELCRARASLEISRDRYSELYDFAPVGYFTFDARGLILESNLSGARLLEIDRQKLAGLPFTNFIADADEKEIFAHHLETVLKSQGMQRCEVRLTGKDGTVIYGQLQSVAVYDVESEESHILSSLVDGTFAKQLGVEVQDAREYAENIVETVRKPLVVMGADLKILSANHSFYELFKVTPEETIGSFIYDLGNRQWDIPGLRVLFEDILPHDTVFNGYEVEHDFPGIGRKTILLNARQIFRKNVGSHIILLAMEEITARKQIEADQEQLAQRLRDHQFYTRSLFESNIDAIMTTDPSGIITDVNKQMEMLTGCTRDELIGAPFKNYFTDPERAEATIKQVLSEKKVSNCELTARARDGKETVVSINATTFYDRDRKLQGVFAAARDVSERKILDQVLQDKNVELESARSAADKANLAKSEFLSSMSHELRSPLNAILGFAQLMESGSPLPTPAQKASIDQILKGGWYLLELINEILDLALIESGRLSMSLEPVSLDDIMLECQAMIEPQANKSGIRMSFPQFERTYFVHADRTRVKQVMINLLSNAIKYNRAQGAVEVTCSESASGRIRISVRDTGEGLSSEKLTQLFQPFNRLGQEASGEEGTGIGLVVSKQLTELMGGEIGVESTVGTGSLFWVDLNVTAAPEPVIGAGEPLASIQAPVQQGTAVRTLLYIEDNRANMQLVEQLIARRPDLRLLSAVDGTQGIALASIHQPDVILMDINLPGISGTQALKILREDPTTAHIPVLAISANAMPHDIKKGLEAGFIGYLTKPINVNEFMEALDMALEHAKKEHI